jgi:hypothetical protein
MIGSEPRGSIKDSLPRKWGWIGATSAARAKSQPKENVMPYLAGVLTGVLITVLVVFLADNFAVATASSGTEPQKIVNWDVAAQKLHSSAIAIEKGAQEVRDDVREAMR